MRRSVVPSLVQPEKPPPTRLKEASPHRRGLLEGLLVAEPRPLAPPGPQRSRPGLAALLVAREPRPLHPVAPARRAGWIRRLLGRDALDR